MRTIIATLSISLCSFTNAQTTSTPIIKSSSLTLSGLKSSSRESKLTEKDIINLSKFKNLNIQKIILKDLSNDSEENSLGLMMEYETFDRISKKTLTVEKIELRKLIEALETIEKKQNSNVGSTNKKYKFVLANSIEVGAVYKEASKSWVNYFIFPTEFYSHSVNEFTKDELKELIRILESAEKEL